MMQVVEELNTLRLDILDQDWVQGIYYSEFLEFGEFPPEYESVLESLEIRVVFRNIMKSIDSWLSSEDSIEEKSWAALSHHVGHQKLLSILAYYIDYGTKNILTKEYRNNAMLASRVYYKLLSISGYKAYHIYHSQLFAQSLACLGFPKVMCDNENSYYNSKELTREVNSIIKELRHFVLDLWAIIDSLQLSPSDMNFADIMSNLVDITGGAIVNKLNVDKIELANISGVIYEIIDRLLCDANGEPNTVAIRELFKCLLPKLVAASVDCKNANNLVRASYVTYSGLLLTKYGKAGLHGYTVMLQHLCFTSDGLERSEVRQARVSLVIGLMSLLPHKSYRSIVKWLLKLTVAEKVSHRQVALEMLAKLMSNEPEDEENLVPEQLKPEQPAENSAAHNGTAIKPETENSEQKEGAIQPKMEISKNETTDESSQDSQQSDNPDHEITEDEVAGLLRQRAHTVPLAAVLRAVYARVDDTSSNLRTRAFAILTECVDSDRPPMRKAMKDLNGDGPVSRCFAVGSRGCCDDRAAVRRAALTLVHHSLAARDAPPPAREDLMILVNLCHDASIIVRSGAITALGELLNQRPGKTVFDSFLNGPMHQLSDPENKIQDLVVNIVKVELIDRLEKYVEGGCEDQLPWMFLDAVIRHGMRHHLRKACSILAKNSGCISHRLVDVLSTHLGVLDDERDHQTLLMLNCMAKEVDYKEVDFVIDYYYRITDDAQPRDRRLLALTIDLCAAWADRMQLSARTALRTHLVRAMAGADDPTLRVACVGLAVRLDPLDLTWATELMHLLERAALSSVEVLEWVRAVDLSLAAAAPPSPALLRLFLGALTSPPPEWTEESRGALVAGLGRLCIRSREAAAVAAPPIAAILEDVSAPLNARSNALHALTDVCTRYTCIVDPLLGSMCDCLKPGVVSELRRAAARELTRLVLAGYLRLRTPLYYRYCALIADEDMEVRQPVEYYMTMFLTAEAIYHHFIDCILHYNKDDTENISFDSRQLIYDVMLQRLSLVQKLNLQCRLAREILEHAADVTDEGDGELPASLNSALLDTITLLCGPRMKLPKKPQRDGDGADIDSLHERVTTNIVSHKMKITVAEVVVPAVLRLHSGLSARGGQVVAYLVRIATDLLNDYRQEIEETIENDAELMQRVLQFQETFETAPTQAGNTRNLVTSSTTNEPETPKAPRKRAGHRAARSPPRKRALRI